jgi:hypothetical protein
MTTTGIAVAVVKDMRRRREIGTLLRNLIMSALIPSQALGDFKLRVRSTKYAYKNGRKNTPVEFTTIWINMEPFSCTVSG